MKPRPQLRDKKITIYRADFTQDANTGELIAAYKPIHPGTVWAYFRHLSARELFAAGRFQNSEEVVFTVNHNKLLTPVDAPWLFILYSGLWYGVQRIDAYEGYLRELRLYCKTAALPDASQLEAYVEPVTPVTPVEPVTPVTPVEPEP